LQTTASYEAVKIAGGHKTQTFFHFKEDKMSAIKEFILLIIGIFSVIKDLILGLIGVFVGLTVLIFFFSQFFINSWCPPAVIARGKLATLIWTTKASLKVGMIGAVGFIVYGILSAFGIL
jgi:hypothetical protein